MFLSEKSDALTLFSEGTTVLGGDLNIPLCPLLDSSTGVLPVPYRALKTHEGRHLLISPARHMAPATPNSERFIPFPMRRINSTA